jgi:hypothetical protein
LETTLAKLWQRRAPGLEQTSMRVRLASFSE